jgi:hypothetical protein
MKKKWESIILNIDVIQFTISSFDLVSEKRKHYSTISPASDSWSVETAAISVKN